MILVKLCWLYGGIQVILAALAIVQHPKSAIVDTGANHTLICSFNHSVNCSWLKNGIPIKMGGRYLYSWNNGISTKDCSVAITNFTAFDAATWQCMANYYDKDNNGMYGKIATLVKADLVKLESADSSGLLSFANSNSIVIASTVVIAAITIAIVGFFLIKRHRHSRSTLKVSTSSQFEPSVNYFSFDGQSVGQSSESIKSQFEMARGTPSGGSICDAEQLHPNSSESSEIKKEDEIEG